MSDKKECEICGKTIDKEDSHLYFVSGAQMCSSKCFYAMIEIKRLFKCMSALSL